MSKLTGMRFTVVTVVTHAAPLPSCSDMLMCPGSMLISADSPSEAAMRPTFFSSLIQVAPQPSSHDT